ncbi:hypothetical protein TH63_10295 [Rufibacter radiotolerans]|uniref:GTA TIM-barrel-like domain-containing protein n=1 Tax=Rufibacter radiotolerans TaxID=1379910 RepID=A0A0H4W683_9BACT|nr:hypothetical protein [Rufibacter radiotolerans]AKQ45946.1 hypothetical protein TH63_10295 [Rufibacter radiotolerans]
MKSFLWLIYACLMLQLVACQSAPSQPMPGMPLLRGVNWVAADTVTLEQLQNLKDHGVEWIAQTPFGWQKAHDQPDLAFSSKRGYWGERDAGLIQTTLLARSLGIKTLLKPHIWLRSNQSGAWVGTIKMNSEADWQAWFKNYRTMLLHYARLADSLQIEGLCIGTELHLTVTEKPEEWRKLIKDVRQVYRGQLTYAANWNEEYEDVPFWDELDFIGVQAYFPLSKATAPPLATLLDSWKPHVRALEKLQRKFNKPVVFTEVGYRNIPHAAAEPWTWPARGEQTEPEDPATQERLYEAMYRTFWHKPWFRGTFIWKWYPAVRTSGRARRDFTPQGLPAARVMARYYQQGN